MINSNHSSPSSPRRLRLSMSQNSTRRSPSFDRNVRLSVTHKLALGRIATKVRSKVRKRSQPLINAVMSAKMLCVQSVGAHTITKLQIVSNLNASNEAQSLHSAQHDRNEDIARAIVNKQRLAAEYVRLMQKRTNRNKKTHSKRLGQVRDEFKAVQKQLNQMMNSHSSAKMHITSLRLCKERLNVVQLLQRTYKEIAYNSSCPTLMESITTRIDTEKKINKVQGSIHWLTKQNKKLKADFDSETVKHKEEVIQMKASVQQFKEKLKQLRFQSEAANKLYLETNTSRYQTQTRVARDIESVLSGQLLALTSGLERERVSFKHTNTYLSRSINKNQTKLKYWNDKYENDTTTTLKSLQDLSATRTVLLHDIQQSEQAYKREMAAQQVRLGEEKIRESMNKKRKRAALKIQALIRGFLRKRKTSHKEEKKAHRRRESRVNSRRESRINSRARRTRQSHRRQSSLARRTPTSPRKQNENSPSPTRASRQPRRGASQNQT